MSFSVDEVFFSVIFALIYGVIFSALFSPILFLFRCAFVTSISIIFFSIGFMLLSYLALDGVLRAYMLILSLTSFFLSKKYIFDRIFQMLKCLIKKVINNPLFGKLKRRHTLDKKG